MATTNFTSLASLILDNYGAAVADAFTLFGPGNSLLSQYSVMGALAEAGQVVIGSGETSDRFSHEWGVHSSTASAGSFGAGTMYPAATNEQYLTASLEWKRVGIPMSFDNLLRVAGRGAGRAGANLIDREFNAKLKSLIDEIEKELISDGTGNGGLDITGMRAFLSATNVYAGINQMVSPFWAANVVGGGGAALTKAMLRDLTQPLFENGGIDNTTEMWMSATQWGKFSSLYTTQLRSMPGKEASDNIVQLYSDGVVNIPIRIIAAMPNNEVWCVKRSGMSLKFLDHNPEDSLPASSDTEIMHQAVPIGIEEVHVGNDTKNYMLKAYAQLGAENPRHHGVITNLLT